MQDDSDGLFYLGAGPVAAILLGMALVPVREMTTASNFTFAFIVLTIVVAEVGGRWPAVATALASALSLDFFLTQPYLRLTIADKNDVIAFAGLAVCGLVAAAFGRQRGERTADLHAAHEHLDLMHAAIEAARAADPAKTRLGKVLEACRAALPITAAVVRDSRGHCVAASTAAHAMWAAPEGVLRPDAPIPAEGARLPLVVANRTVGWLDLWGTGTATPPSAQHTLADFASVLAFALAGDGPGADQH